MDFDAEAAQVWGPLRVPDPAHELDKQLAAIALVNRLAVVARNTADFAGTRVWRCSTRLRSEQRPRRPLRPTTAA